MTSLALLILLLAVYVAGFFVAWALLTRSHYRRYGCQETVDLVEGSLGGFFGALFWPMLLVGYAFGLAVRRFA